jgi:hypothetical protein
MIAFPISDITAPVLWRTLKKKTVEVVLSVSEN